MNIADETLLAELTDGDVAKQFRTDIDETCYRYVELEKDRVDLTRARLLCLLDFYLEHSQ